MDYENRKTGKDFLKQLEARGIHNLDDLGRCVFNRTEFYDQNRNEIDGSINLGALIDIFQGDYPVNDLNDDFVSNHERLSASDQDDVKE